MAALLGCMVLLGCQPRVIDALANSGGMGGSSPDASGGNAEPDSGSAHDALAYYSFDQGSGTAVHDDSGHGHDGRLLGGTWTNAGRFGGALRFDAPDAGVVVDPFPQAVSDWSASFWLLVQSADLTGVSTVLSNEITFAGGWEVNVQPKDATFGNLEFAYSINGAYAKASCDCVTLGVWTHVVAVVNGSALTIQLFQDGVATASATASGQFMPGNPYLYLGRWDGTGRPLLGVLDEVAIYDRTLSPAEVAQLYAGTVP